VSKTRPTGEQLRFRSAKTGDHILDDYLEAVEKGDRTLADLLSDIYDSDTGLFRADIFEFRVAGPTGLLEFRVGDFADTSSGWRTTSVALLEIIDPEALPLASAANMHEGTLNRLVTTDAIYSGSAPVTLTDAGTVTPDFTAGRNFTLTLGGNRTLANPTNQAAGQAGIIIVRQDATGSRNLAFGSAYKLSDGLLVLSTAPNAIDVINYYVESPGTVLCTIAYNFG
jgi:hypothetical protein